MAAAHFVGKLPEQSDGSVTTLARLVTDGLEAATNSAGSPGRRWPSLTGTDSPVIFSTVRITSRTL